MGLTEPTNSCFTERRSSRVMLISCPERGGTNTLSFVLDSVNPLVLICQSNRYFYRCFQILVTDGKSMVILDSGMCKPQSLSFLIHSTTVKNCWQYFNSSKRCKPASRFSYMVISVLHHQNRFFKSSFLKQNLTVGGSVTDYRCKI